MNIASNAGRVGSSGEAVYSACKGGLIALTKTLAREMVARGIRLKHDLSGANGHCDPAQLHRGTRARKSLRTEARHSYGAPRRAGRLCGRCRFFASDDAAYITGQTISVSGGLTMAG